MLNADVMLKAFAELVGLKDLKFDGNGNAQLSFDSRLPVYLMKIDDYSIEFVSRLSQLPPTLSAYSLRKLLEANHAGAGTMAARLAHEPVKGGVVLCQRVDVRPLEVLDFKAALFEFVGNAMHWCSPEAAAELMPPQATPVSKPDDFEADDVFDQDEDDALPSMGSFRL